MVVKFLVTVVRKELKTADLGISLEVRTGARGTILIIRSKGAVGLILIGQFA